MALFLLQMEQRNSYHLSESPLYNPEAPPLFQNNGFLKDSAPPAPDTSSGSRISPAILFIIVVLAFMFFISGLLHLLVRFLVKHRSSSSISESNRYPESSGSDAYERQLQQLFHLHDSGLDQSLIDALPVFMYKEIVGSKEPFDCAVCLCEFSEEDKLRLLPLCSHAFHIDCIDTWLLSNSTCPLCRGAIFTPGLPFDNPIFSFEDPREEDRVSGIGGNGVAGGPKPPEDATINERRVMSVRLGKFRGTNEGGIGAAVQRSEGETSSSNLDARRCYSMGSYQYVVADSELQVALCPSKIGSNSLRIVKGKAGHFGNSSTDKDAEGKKINIASKGDSFSVSKIWLWSKKGKFPSSSESHIGRTVHSILP